MTVPGNIDALLLGGQRGYQIERSLRFNSADSAYLNRTAGTPTDNKKWTWSAWAKITGTSQALNFASSGGGTSMYFGLETSQGDNFIMQIAGTRVYKSTAIFRDSSAWYHFVFVFDSANGTQADRSILYVNGVRQAATTASVTLDQTTGFNAASTVMNIGYSNAWTATSSDYFSGYLTEIHFIDGQALTPSSFGETDTITGVWKPKKYAGTYGTNGFYLKFADNSGTTSTTLGKDSSGNGNNWTPNNFSVTAGAGNDSLIDVPTPYADGGNGRGNYCTLNPLSFGPSNADMIDGNLQFNQPTATTGNAKGTIAVSSGKWYWEVTPQTTTTANVAGGILGAAETSISAQPGNYATGYSYLQTGEKRNNSVSATYGASYGANDVIGTALDLDAGTLVFYKNGVSQGTAFSGLSGTFVPAIGDASTGSSSQLVCNFGQRAFAYTPPSGFLALNTQNLPEPSIKKPNQWMDATTYTGNGSVLAVNNSGSMQPSLLWIKGRSSATDHQLVDAVRGAKSTLVSNTTAAETVYGADQVSFDSGGFTVGGLSTMNANSSTYVCWQWKESATPGFDIVTYTGNGTARTIAHSLGVAPSMMIVKRRDSSPSEWWVYHSALGATKSLVLNSTSAQQTLSYIWNDTAPTSSVFSLGFGGDVNGNGGTFVAYLWSEVAGFSKFGSYTGNGSSDGPFVFCGFRPRFIMIKNSTNSGVGYSWFMYDSARNTFNITTESLLADSSQATYTDPVMYIDVLSNGFKIRGTAIGVNNSSATMIFAAFAESPFKYSLAR